MPLGNIVMLEPDIPERMHFTAHVIAKRDITDPLTGKPGIRNVLEFDVDRLNGAAVSAKFGTFSEGLYGKLEAYLAGQVYKNYEFIISKHGTGYHTRYKVETIPLGK